jgi:hypothetical protein
MKAINTFIWTAALAIVLAPVPAHAGLITPGDIVVERIGDGSTTLSGAAAPVFVDEYTTAGVFKQSIPMPTSASGAQLALTDSGSATSDGYLNVSLNGKFITVPGYNATVGTASVASAAGITRVIGRVDLGGNVDTSTNFGGTGANAFAGNNFRSAFSTDGTTIWGSGTATAAANAGVWTIQFGTTGGSQVSTTSGSPVLTNVRVLEGFGPQLYVSNSTATTGLQSGVNAVGSGYPTSSGNPLTNLPGLDNNITGGGNSSPYDFFFAKLSPLSSGFDTAYVADDGATVAAGIAKFSLVGGSWVFNNKIGVSGDAYRGLTGLVNADGSVSLYATRQSGAAQGIVALTDTSGFNANDNGTPNLIVPLATNTAFRGIDLIPVMVPEPSTFLLAIVAAGGAVAMRRRARLRGE